MRYYFVYYISDEHNGVVYVKTRNLFNIMNVFIAIQLSEVEDHVIVSNYKEVTEAEYNFQYSLYKIDVEATLKRHNVL